MTQNTIKVFMIIDSRVERSAINTYSEVDVMLWFIILPKDRDRAISNSKTRFRAKMRTLNLQMHDFYYCCAFPCLAQRLNIHVRVEI